MRLVSHPHLPHPYTQHDVTYKANHKLVFIRRSKNKSSLFEDREIFLAIYVGVKKADG